MWTKQKRRTNRNRFILPLLTIGVLGYFSYHIYHGEYGLFSRAVIDARIAGLNAELDKVENERKGLEKRISLLRDGTIEKDMLDEYARRNLNLSLPNELTIIVKNAEK